METIKIGALADSGDLYPFIPMILGKVRPADFDIEFEFIPTVQEVNDKVVKKEVDISVPSAALYPYIQNNYYILSSAVASAVDGITGMPVLSVDDITMDDLPNSKIIVHGLNTTAFNLYKLLIGKYKKLVVVHRVLDEINAMVNEDGVMVAVHELKAMYDLKKMGITPKRIVSMWDMWKNLSGNKPMPMGMVVINSDLGEETALKFKEFYNKSKKYAEEHMDEILPEDIRLMREIQNANIEEDVIKGTIGADVKEYNVNLNDVKSGLEFFYGIMQQKNLLPGVNELRLI
ncbi:MULTISPECIES: MqnA/MqnD/SBP family protein [unclassified Acidiplasma]|uniref:MqnA/MqnD/SBP family protein n=1 Tax=unclassified Acidiplasma TaxID=2641301 RepID=UPI0005E4C065|nr:MULTISPECIES: MqnA/MqnD/SBP family protein [unclassified Acidiplasma]KJE49266.1 ABC transporter substrate-binding protein [Acidiplasma sp. MBA-1]WMT54760.1 MAG: MqnA/MqnD/SBP family protein [Acidiplasma sp.]